jgi:hypothetical protein
VLDTTRRIRAEVYNRLASTGRAPSVAELAESTGAGRDSVEDDLCLLHDGHDLVLGTNGEVRMALPFSAVPTRFTVTADGVDHWANCAWDALAIPITLKQNATISAEVDGDTATIEMDVTDGTLAAPDGLVHFAVPARRWWDDIVDT